MAKTRHRAIVVDGAKQKLRLTEINSQTCSDMTDFRYFLIIQIIRILLPLSLMNCENQPTKSNDETQLLHVQSTIIQANRLQHTTHWSTGHSTICGFVVWVELSCRSVDIWLWHSMYFRTYRKTVNFYWVVKMWFETCRCCSSLQLIVSKNVQHDFVHLFTV